ncbi:25037_t:CDS:2, partial [Gigaspora margarita]
LFNDLESKHIKVIALVTDSAAAYAAARKQLQVKHAEKITLPCFTHQINLCVGEIFKESPTFKEAINNATTITTYFGNVSHAYFIGKL